MKVEQSVLPSLPKVFFGTSGFGNLFQETPYEDKLQIVKECFNHAKGKVVFDSAGKYGAGLSLESLGKCLQELDIAPEDVVISNKLGWYRAPLLTPEPTFEPGVWKGLKHDAVQKISYQGIMECFEQGNELLGQYIPQMISVHDPDEYLATAKDAAERAVLLEHILEAYRALADLKQKGLVQSIGVGAKNWKSIEEISKFVALDWIMFANSMTIKHHPKDLLDFMQAQQDKGVYIVNSAVFHSGFLIGTDYYDYQLLDKENTSHQPHFEWRERFFELCKQYGISPAEACVQFALAAPGVKSIALNTTSPRRVAGNIAMADVAVPAAFWKDMQAAGLIADYIKY